jgi:hypothetical protein
MENTYTLPRPDVYVIPDIVTFVENATQELPDLEAPPYTPPVE